MPDTGQGTHRTLNARRAGHWHPGRGTTASNTLLAAATLLAALLFLVLVAA